MLVCSLFLQCILLHYISVWVSYMPGTPQLYLTSSCLLHSTAAELHLLPLRLWRLFPVWCCINLYINFNSLHPSKVSRMQFFFFSNSSAFCWSDSSFIGCWDWDNRWLVLLWPNTLYVLSVVRMRKEGGQMEAAGAGSQAVEPCAHRQSALSVVCTASHCVLSQPTTNGFCVLSCLSYFPPLSSL